MQSLLYQLLPSFPSALPGPNHIQATATSRWSWPLSWGQHQPNNLANTVAMKTVSSNHVAADQVFRNIAGLPHLHIDFAVWYILMQFDAALRFGSGILMRLCVWARGWGCPMCSSVWFVTGYASFPRHPLRWLLEAAQRRVISHRECRVQERAVRQDHQLHWRGESTPAQGAGPLAGNCTRGGAPDIFPFIL